MAATRPSIPAFLGMLVVAGALAMASWIVVTPTRLGSINPGYIMSSPFDTYGLLTCNVMELRRTGIDPDAVVLLGTSALEHAVTSEADLQGIAEESPGFDRPIHLLYGPALTLWEMGAVVENLPEGFHGTIIINITPVGLSPDDNYLNRINNSPRLGFTSKFIRSAAEAQGLKVRKITGIYLLDNAPFFAARVSCLRNLVAGPHKVGRLYDDRPALPDPGRWRRMNDFFGEYVRGIEKQDQANGSLRTLADLVALCRERGATRIILIESVLNPAAVAEWPQEPLQIYDRVLDDFVAVHDVERWDLTEETAATPDDFVDWVHMKPGAARDRYTRALAQRIGALASTPPSSKVNTTP